MEYEVGCLADMISEASGKKTPKSNKKIVAPKVKYEKLEVKKISTSNISNRKQGHKQDELPKKRIRFCEPLAMDSNLNESIGSHQVEDQHVKRQTCRKINYEEEQRTIFVGNVSKTSKKEDLRRIFASCGFIESIRFRSLSVADPSMSKKVAMIKKQLHPHRSNMNAYIKFRDVESTHTALAKNGEVLNNHTLRVDLALNKQNYNPKACVFLGNLKFLTDEEHLRKAFRDCGKILNVRIVRDKATGMGKGIAFIEFKNSTSVELALKLDGKDLLGRCIRVSRLRGQDKGSTKGKKKNRRRAERKQTSEGKRVEKQQSLKNGFIVTPAADTNKIHGKQQGSQEQNKSILSEHLPKGALSNKRNKVSSGTNNKKTNAKEQRMVQKNKSRPILSQFQGEKTGLKKIKKKKKVNKGELKKKVMLSKLEIIPKLKKKKVGTLKSKKSKQAIQK